MEGAPYIADVPLCVDLDGTLVCTDTFAEACLQLLKRDPRSVARIPGWWSGSITRLKDEVTSRTQIDPKTLPYHPELLEFVRAERARGRPVVLATASHKRVARAIADHLGLFTDIVATDSGTGNLGGQSKAEALVAKYGEKGFDYVGNSTRDLPVWKRARNVLVAGRGGRFTRMVAEQMPVSQHFPPVHSPLGAAIQSLRPHQWAKNILVLLPAALAHVTDAATWGAALLATAAFCLVSSGLYIINDLLDIEADRLHPTRRRRPLASGALSAGTGVMLGGVSLAMGLLLSWFLAPAVTGTLLLYTGLVLLYSAYLKRLPILDVLVLSSFYGLRLVAGAAAAGVMLSSWLVGFSLFLFLSLAMAKRHCELQRMGGGKEAVAGRGYRASDAPVLMAIGVGSGLVSVLVLALYVSSAQVTALYDRPWVLWCLCAILCYWISRLWLLVHRDEMHDDPILFALHDHTSTVVGLLAAAALLFAL